MSDILKSLRAFFIGLVLGAICTPAHVWAGQIRAISQTPHAPNPLAPPETPDVLSDLSPPKLTFLSSGNVEGDGRYQPEIGQAGKDVIWVPTPDSLIRAMLTVADVKSGDYVVDLGSGDGRIAIAAARDFGARSLGLEYNPDLVALARRSAARQGVHERAQFKHADIFQTDFSSATVVTLYLLPSLNLKLRDTLLNMKPGTRIVSHAFNMGDWKPDRTISTDDANGYFWIVPAKVNGKWAFEIGEDRFVLDLNQKFQFLTLSNTTKIKEARLQGASLELKLADGRKLNGKVKTNEIEGMGWHATRITAK